MSKPKAGFKPGDAFFVMVGKEHINDSDPCNKDKCMVNRAFIAWAEENYPGQNLKPKSTNHGIVFELGGRKYIAVFDTRTAFRIYNYDQIFRKTHSKEKARQAVRPFKVRMMVESSTAVTKWPAMSEETKKKLRAMPRKKSSDYTPKKHSSHSTRRELSL